MWKILHSHQRMMFLQNKGTAKASQTDLLASNITLNSTTRTNHLLVSRLYDTERPVQKYPQWKCSFTDQRIFVPLWDLAQQVLIHMKAKKKRCLLLLSGSIASLFISLYHRCSQITNRVPADSTLDHDGLKFSIMSMAS